jgi:pimeloyl-ACP methyl ester carboxylesterase
MIKLHYTTVAFKNLFKRRSSDRMPEVNDMSENSADAILENNSLKLSGDTRKARPEPFILKVFQIGFQISGRISTALAGRMAYKLWLTPTRFKTPASEQKALKSALIESHRINDNDITTFTWQPAGEGDSPTVLLVHGWGGRGTQMGSFAEPLNNAGYRVISFDAPAHGKSSGKQTNLYEISETILALQDIYGGFDSVITHSFGGPCTAHAIRLGLKANRIVSICPPATTIGLIDKFCDALLLNGKTRQNLVDRITTAFGGHIWEELSMKNAMRGVDIPGLVIHDAHDDDVPWQEGQAVAHAWNNAPFIITSGLGHRRILRDSSVIEATLKFLKGQ